MAKVVNCRIYQRESSHQQDLAQQQQLITAAILAGYRIAGIYTEKTIALPQAHRPELTRLTESLQADEVVLIEKIEHLIQVPLLQVEQFLETVKQQNVQLQLANLADCFSLSENAPSACITLLQQAKQSLLGNLILLQAKEHNETFRRRQADGIRQAKADNRYTGRKSDQALHRKIIQSRVLKKLSLSQTAAVCGCSISTVKRVMREYNRQS